MAFLKRGPVIYMAESRKSHKKATENRKSQKKTVESRKKYLAVNRKMPPFSGGKPEKVGKTGGKWKEIWEKIHGKPKRVLRQKNSF